MNEKKEKIELASFGMGCFWQSEEIFRVLPGVLETAVGFMGGKLENPSYEQVSTSQTGHIEVVQIKFDSNIVSYEDILKIFWENHDPTTPNRQGPDIGSQYRSVIFYYNEEQKKAALMSKEDVEKSGKYNKPIVTEIIPASFFYPAPDYHQKYLVKRGLKVCH